jgi:hypothetical protein
MLNKGAGYGRNWGLYIAALSLMTLYEKKKVVREERARKNSINISACVPVATYEVVCFTAFLLFLHMLLAFPFHSVPSYVTLFLFLHKYSNGCDAVFIYKAAGS